MKFAINKPCDCGGQYVFSAYGDVEFGSATCSNCRKSTHLMNPLSVSLTAERLLYRSKAELESGDYSLSLVIAVMAIESYLTRLFLKLKGMDSYASTFSLPTPTQEVEWEKEYLRSGGFSGPIGFVSQRVVGDDLRQVCRWKYGSERDIFIASKPHSNDSDAIFPGGVIQSA
jgi:hypothetical protein